MPPQIAAARPSSAARGLPTFRAAGSGARVSGQAAFKPPRPRAPEQRQKGKRPQERIDVDEEVVDLDDNDNGHAADTSRRRGKRPQGSGTADVLAASDNIDEDGDGNKNDNDDIGGDDDETDSGAPSIPPELLTRLLHHFFSKPNSRITQDANTSVGKYMEIFVREAVARSVAERRDGGFLDVDVLQKVAAQLIMDM